MVSNLEVYKSNNLNPYENLAIEKYLLDTVGDSTLRLYLWQNDNTVVIGRNQNPWAECNCALLDAEGGFVARRLSGGGAVYHDIGNLNFTFICNEENYNLNNNLEVIKRACGYADITAQISGRNDILTNGKKFSGNAFYHANGKAYHHGTLLISSSAEKIERYLTPKQQKLAAKGVKSVKSRVINLSELNPTLTPEVMAEYMIKALESVYSLQSYIIDHIEKEKIEDNTKLFGSWDYIYGKTPPFSISFSKHFQWGCLDVNLSLSGGKIAHIKVFTDSMDFSLAEKIEVSLTDSEFNLSAIKSRLKKSFDTVIYDDILSVFEDAFINNTHPKS